MPKGSKRARTDGVKAWVVDQQPQALAQWEYAVRFVLQNEWKGPPTAEPVSVILYFNLLKPKSAPKKRLYPVTKPDVDKLARAVLDALTGIAIVDDSQVIEIRAVKDYADEPGVGIALTSVSMYEVVALRSATGAPR